MPAITVIDLENAKLDVGHIAEVATSLNPTATDRMGHVKRTIQGAIDTISAITIRDAWVAETAYAVKDVVEESGTWYIAVIAHTSSAAFATDILNWRVYQGVIAEELADPATGAAMVGYGAGTVKDALDSNAVAIGAVNDRLKPSLLIPRARPAGFEYVPGNIWECLTSGQAKHDIDLEQEFCTTYGAEMGEESGPSGSFDVWVDPVNGSDSDSGSIGAPLKTLAQAIANTIGTIWLVPGRYTERFDVRNSYRQLGSGDSRALMIKAWGGANSVMFVAPGQQPSEMTWAASGQLWEATPSGGESADLILFIDSGIEFPIQYKTSSSEVDSSNYGWYQDPTTKKISMRYQGRNIETDKLKFEIIYQPPAAPIVYGGKIYVEGVRFRGLTQMDIRYENSVRPIFYAKNCTWEYGGGSNVSTQGAICFTQNCTSRRALVNDGLNYYDSVAAGTTPGGVPTQALEIDNICVENGVPECESFVNYPSNQTRSKQGSSGHEQSIICRINGVYSGNYGQSIADTGIGSKTWMIGSICENPFGKIGGGAALGGFYNLWTEGSAWLDTVTAGGRLSTEGLHVETGNCKTYRCGFTGTDADVFVGDSATLTGYDALAAEI